MAKRHSHEVTVWVATDLNSCSLPGSNIQTFCGISYKVPTIILNRISRFLMFAMNSYVMIQAQLPKACAEAVNNMMCKSALPQCSADATSFTYQNYTTDCTTVGSCWPFFGYNSKSYTGTLSFDADQLYDLAKCVPTQEKAIEAQS
ncbi:hypothetical protein TrispH2_010512 [Trichoplax sp. H2]|nr:hypothetical protein TrispH2_010512 [Trichoplax sp. H2]|eukprot:RDD37849.1 hypothetical protein TrispH2_010512 [Trichoplax sp. H2]